MVLVSDHQYLRWILIRLSPACFMSNVLQIFALEIHHLLLRVVQGGAGTVLVGILQYSKGVYELISIDSRSITILHDKQEGRNVLRALERSLTLRCSYYCYFTRVAVADSTVACTPGLSWSMS